MTAPPARRILFMAEAVTLAHVVRPLVLAQALDPQQYTVHFAADDRYDFVFRDSPVQRQYPLASISSEQFLSALSSGSRVYEQPTLEKYVAADVELLDQVRPDLVVGDFRLSLAVSAPLCQVPYATIANAHWSPYTTRRWMPLPEHAIERILGERLGTALFRLVQPAVFRYHAAPLNRLRRQRGMNPLGSLLNAYTHADHTLYADIPSIAPTQNLPDNHRYLGPIVWSPSASLPPWWSELGEEAAVIYATLGTSGNTGVLPELLRAVSGLPVKMALATAGRLEIENRPENVMTADFLPGELAAARADVVVCNGGSATVYQSLSQGTPLLGIPSNMDQHLTMEAVQQRGAGIMVRRSHAIANNLRSALMQILEDPSFRISSRALAEEMRSFDACEHFRRFVQTVTSG